MTREGHMRIRIQARPHASADLRPGRKGAGSSSVCLRTRASDCASLEDSFIHCGSE